MTGEETSAHGPLDGLLVADFSRVLAGPYATMLLGDLGADVVKVESPGGDDTRTWMPPTRGDVATYYLAINRNKRSVVLDFTDPADRLLAQELARRADVLIENFKPGGLAKYGLDHETVAAANPGVVYASITGFGAGAGAGLPGYDLMVQAMSGLMSLTGDPDGPPYRAGISVFDVMSGMQTAIGILAALRDRERTGRGQRVEVDLMSAALSGLVNHTSAYVAGGAVPHRMGNAHPSLFPYEPLPTADGELIVHRRQRRPVRPAVQGARRRGAGRRPAVPPEPGPHGQPGRAAPAAGGGARRAHPPGVVRRADRGRCALRPDQQRGRRCAVRQRTSASSRSLSSGPERPRSRPSATRFACPAARFAIGCRRPASTNTAASCGRGSRRRWMSRPVRRRRRDRVRVASTRRTRRRSASRTPRPSGCSATTWPGS